ncbi:MAG: methyltransferase domain-containing protein [Aurantibacter sp.]
MKEDQAYILGTDEEELFRLGLQHQVWAEEAQHGWRLANFKSGQTLLDLGCGPGYCTKELAFVVGRKGKVIGIDKSVGFIEFLKQVAQKYNLNIEAVASDFDQMVLEPKSLDGMYCRWALAWIPNPSEVLSKVYKALKPNGKMVIQEYYDWSTLQTEPRKEALAKGIAMALKSFKDTDNEIDIGRHLPKMLGDIGMRIISHRPMIKIATIDNGVWQWPKTFFQSYFPRLVPQNYLTDEDVKKALAELEELEKKDGASICTCLMVEIIAEKQ